MRRTIYPIQSGNSEIELTIDKGKVEAGRQSSPLCEVELELKRGESAELFKLARMLAEEVPVQLAVKSKAEHGYALIAGRAAEAVKAAPVALTPAHSRQAAFQVIARACLRQLVANQAATLGGDAEGLHQMHALSRPCSRHGGLDRGWRLDAQHRRSHPLAARTTDCVCCHGRAEATLEEDYESGRAAARARPTAST